MTQRGSGRNWWKRAVLTLVIGILLVMGGCSALVAGVALVSGEVHVEPSYLKPREAPDMFKDEPIKEPLPGKPGSAGEAREPAASED
jgi:hypothetical protein